MTQREQLRLRGNFAAQAPWEWRRGSSRAQWRQHRRGQREPQRTASGKLQRRREQIRRGLRELLRGVGPSGYRLRRWGLGELSATPSVKDLVAASKAGSGELLDHGGQIREHRHGQRNFIAASGELHHGVGLSGYSYSGGLSGNSPRERIRRCQRDFIPAETSRPHRFVAVSLRGNR